MQVPILSGVTTSETPGFRASYPRNMVPVPMDQGISKGYLRPAPGIAAYGVGPGIDRGAIVWRGECYRVMGNSLVRVERGGTVTILGAVAGEGPVSFDYSFDRLIIAAGGGLFYWSGTALTRVTDPDLGYVVDALWVDGYTMTTDGDYIVVTDLNDPSAVNPLKYGSSEADPDPVVGLLKLRNEVFAVNRYTMEQFNNVGGSLFPFARNEGAQLQRGALGTRCAVPFTYGQNEVIAFLGGGRGEPAAAWVGVNGVTTKISTGEIDTILQDYAEDDLRTALLETRIDKAHQLLYIHLPDQTLVFDGAASLTVQEPVWYVLTSSIEGLGKYRARNIVWCYDRWMCGDPTSNALGELVDTVSTHYGQTIGWEFGTTVIYNESRGAIFHMLELVTLPGRVPLGAKPVVWTSYSVDGVTWSQERSCNAGGQGARGQRLTWLRQGSMQQWRIQRFRGTSDAHLAVARLEVQLEPLYV